MFNLIYRILDDPNIYGPLFWAIIICAIVYGIYSFKKEQKEAERKAWQIYTEKRIESETEKRVEEELKKRGINK